MGCATSTSAAAAPRSAAVATNRWPSSAVPRIAQNSMPRSTRRLSAVRPVMVGQSRAGGGCGKQFRAFQRRDDRGKPAHGLGRANSVTTDPAGALSPAGGAVRCGHAPPLERHLEATAMQHAHGRAQRPPGDIGHGAHRMRAHRVGMVGPGDDVRHHTVVVLETRGWARGARPWTGAHDRSPRRGPRAPARASSASPEPPPARRSSCRSADRRSSRRARSADDPPGTAPRTTRCTAPARSAPGPRGAPCRSSPPPESSPSPRPSRCPIPPRPRSISAQRGGDLRRHDATHHLGAMPVHHGAARARAPGGSGPAAAAARRWRARHTPPRSGSGSRRPRSPSRGSPR